MRDSSKRRMAYLGLIVTPLVALVSVIVTSGLASADTLASIVSAFVGLSALVTTFIADRERRGSGGDDEHD
jgi:hypothetical protein